MGNHWENDDSLVRVANPERPGRGKQDYGTPVELLCAVRFGLAIKTFYWDLAASHDNAVSTRYFTAEDDALHAKYQWNTPPGEWNWCNPPFGIGRKFVQKAYETRMTGSHALLVPAAVGANWWRDWVHKKAMVYFLNGRLTFVGETAPYKKDCAILLYSNSNVRGYAVWEWRKMYQQWLVSQSDRREDSE